VTRAAWLGAAIALAGCAGAPLPPAAPPYTPSAPLPGAAAVAFTIPRAAEPPGFFELPWPSELSRRSDGRPDFSGYPGRDALIFDAYVDAAAEDVDGYALSPAVYFRFTAPLPAPRWPADPRATASARAPVFLVDVDPESPDRGAFYPLDHRWYDADLRFVPAHTLAVKPIAGVVLRPATLYAAVVRRELGGPGDELGTPMDLEIVKWTSPRADAREERARRLHAGALDYLASLGVPRDRVASIALFRTHAPHRVTARLVDVIAHLPPSMAPRVLDAAWIGEDAGYAVIEGTYCTPNFQSDLQRAPFLTDEGGRFVLDPSGAPRVIDVPAESPYRSAECGGLLRARFVLTIPSAQPMPPEGFPLLVSAHGTGGDARSFLGRERFAGWAASQGIAVVSTDQPLHGGRGRAPRPGSREPFRISIAGIPIKLSDDPRGNEAAFYNPVNPAAARDNLRQAAADLMVLARLLPATDLARFLPPNRPAPRLDPARVLAAGHSQGAQSVAAVGAVDPIIHGVILSGCGGDARLGILRRRDLPVVPAFGMLLGLEPGELDELHPLMTLVQTLADAIDPATYARLYREPLPGRRPQMVLHYEGVSDTFTPPVTAEALAVALQATPIGALVRPVPGLGAPASLRELLRRGEAPRAYVQLASTRGENGHFVLFFEPGAADLTKAFLRAAARR
jgi:predicted esterase